MQTLVAQSQYNTPFGSPLCYQAPLISTSSRPLNFSRSKSYDVSGQQQREELTQYEIFETIKKSIEEPKKHSVDSKKIHLEVKIENSATSAPEIKSPLISIADSALPNYPVIDEKSPEREYFMRCVVIGCQNTGKHSLINNNFPKEQANPIRSQNTSDLLVKNTTKFRSSKKYHFWLQTLTDTTPKATENVWKAYYKSAQAFVFVYNTGSRQSFEALKKAIANVLQEVPKEKFFGVLVGTRSDEKAKRDVPIEEVYELKAKSNLSYLVEVDKGKEEQAPEILKILDSKLKLTFEAI